MGECNAEKLALIAFCACLFCIRQETVHSGSEHICLLRTEKQGDVAAFAKIKIAASDGDFLDDRVVKGPQQIVRLNRELFLESFADQLSAGPLHRLIEE